MSSLEQRLENTRGYYITRRERIKRKERRAQHGALWDTGGDPYRTSHANAPTVEAKAMLKNLEILWGCGSL